ncbi:MAG: TIGR01459 family HAD-type hydrolase [Rhizobiales bacterium]|nr:TIGR01459 family HAD-type hydrolase [Hyphomicrobiales bacterium]MBO6697551.1 TIGR01459 family HAD-type hydrolase [Hyphomicrobiales bacterium]MBO6736194.1 TIGR01459 family HAD-type hydrolase [Hyphomicrobiales bacterium]MBO6912664.1 TIGR01459 family HAD-type hydrolase [Hyphomicrobiales bacterium]MBO6956397.1 TIGR01459 family HAD-type hydrolase [Hyphomicrobiales bacterium]
MHIIDSLMAVADQCDAVVFDQWGVLHNGSTPYPGAAEAIVALAAAGKKLAVLSNSGKRAAPNRERIAAMGLPADLFDEVMTSGEAFWQDVHIGRVNPGRLFAITAKPGDEQRWGEGLSVEWTDNTDEADAVLLMGLPEGGDGVAERAQLDEALKQGLPLFCTNPDRGSPRADGVVQLSPGALAHAYQDSGVDVVFYGKPYRPVFDALAAALCIAPSSILMVGDSLEHDVAGGAAAGWKTAFVTGGLHAEAFEHGDALATAAELAKEHQAPLPDFVIGRLAGERKNYG